MRVDPVASIAVGRLGAVIVAGNPIATGAAMAALVDPCQHSGDWIGRGCLLAISLCSSAMQFPMRLVLLALVASRGKCDRRAAPVYNHRDIFCDRGSIDTTLLKNQKYA